MREIVQRLSCVPLAGKHGKAAKSFVEFSCWMSLFMWRFCRSEIKVLFLVNVLTV